MCEHNWQVYGKATTGKEQVVTGVYILVVCAMCGVLGYVKDATKIELEMCDAILEHYEWTGGDNRVILIPDDPLSLSKFGENSSLMH